MLDIVGLFMHDFLLCETWCVACGSKPFDRASQHFACGPWEVSAVKHLLGFLMLDCYAQRFWPSSVVMKRRGMRSGEAANGKP